MAASAKTTPRAAKRPAAKKAPARPKRRVWRIAVPLAIVGWLAVSHLVIRPKTEQWLEARFSGTAKVGFALVWPDLDVSLYSVTLRSERFRIDASTVAVGVRAWGIFGDDLVSDVAIDGLHAELVHGTDLALFKEPVREGEAAPEDESLDLDPPRVPPLTLTDPKVTLRVDDEIWSLLEVGVLHVRQAGDRIFHVETDPGALGRIPFEKLTTRLIPRANHVLLSELKLRAFNGMVGGFIDCDTSRFGSVNGELEWHFVEIESIWDTYDLPYAEKRRGDLSGRVVFKGDKPRVEAMTGSGTVRMSRARFFSPIGFKVFLTLKIPVAQESMLTSGDLAFSFEKSLLYIEEAKANARGFALEGRGIVSFAGAADLEVGHAGTTVRVSGSLDDPSIKVLPLSGVTLPFDRMFREKVK